ncbi:MAG: porin family protein [Proteobacteria bacterium]|nr:porin family protein [Pseudomonadota bacterium]
MRYPLLLAVAMLFSAPAYAADDVNVPSASFDWSGPYAGASTGFGWTSGEGKHYCYDDLGEYNGPFCQRMPDGTDDIAPATGAMFGGQVGYNWQRDKLVIGAEADISAAAIAGSHTIDGPFPFVADGYPAAEPAGVYEPKSEIDWMGTVRARVGLSVTDRMLLFATGGLAYARVSASTFYTSPLTSTTYEGSDSGMQFGWTVGGGVEYAVSERWSLKLEGLYYDLGAVDVVGTEAPLTFPPDGFEHNSKFQMTGGIVRVGVNFHF